MYISINYAFEKWASQASPAGLLHCRLYRWMQPATWRRSWCWSQAHVTTKLQQRALAHNCLDWPETCWELSFNRLHTTQRPIKTIPWYVADCELGRKMRLTTDNSERKTIYKRKRPIWFSRPVKDVRKRGTRSTNSFKREKSLKTLLQN